MRQNNTGDTKPQVGQVHSGVEKRESGRKGVEIPPPALPDVGVVSVVQNGDSIVIVIVAASLFARRAPVLWQKSC